MTTLSGDQQRSLTQIFSNFQQKFNTSKFNNLSKDQVKEIITQIAKDVFKLPDPYYNSSHNRIDGIHEDIEITWNYEYGWIANTCTLTVVNSEINWSLFSPGEQNITHHVITLTDWNQSGLDYSIQDVKTFWYKVSGVVDTLIGPWLNQ